jgi:DNA polymerase-3 subunit epsilon
MLAVYGQPLRYLCGLRPMPELDIAADPVARPVDVRENTDGWMTTLLGRRAQPTADTIDGQRYIDIVTEALADGRLLGGEPQTLVRLGASAGLGAPRVEALHERLLENLRAAALTDAILTTGQLRQLRTAAAALGLPTYFDELRPTSPQDLIAGRSAAPSARVPASSQARPSVPLCTHCHQDGHNRATCPERAALSV